MKITKKQLRRIIKEQLDRMDSGIYDEAESLALDLVEDLLNSHGQTYESLTSISQAFRDLSTMLANDAELIEDAEDAGDF